DRRIDGRIVDALVQADFSKTALADEPTVRELIDGKVKPYLQKHHPEANGVKFDIQADPEPGGVKIHCPARLGGGRKACTIDFAFLDTAEYDDLRRLAAEMTTEVQPPYVIERGSERFVTKLPAELAKRMEDLGRKGLTIQRYKGLGEMDAEQLWE